MSGPASGINVTIYNTERYLKKAGPMSDIYTPSDASSNVAPTITVARGWETWESTYTGPVLTPFWGVFIGDEENDDLTVTVTFDPSA